MWGWEDGEWLEGASTVTAGELLQQQQQQQQQRQQKQNTPQRQQQQPQLHQQQTYGCGRHSPSGCGGAADARRALSTPAETLLALGPGGLLDAALPRVWQATRKQLRRVQAAATEARRRLQAERDQREAAAASDIGPTNVITRRHGQHQRTPAGTLFARDLGRK
jgi:hypothetical protein